MRSTISRIEAARKDSERALRRLNLMFGAISATNEAILRAKTEQELYQRVCDAAVHSGKAIATVVLLAERRFDLAEAGRGHRRQPPSWITQSRFSIDPDNLYGNGICGKAFRTQKPCVNDDVAQFRAGPSVAAGRARRPASSPASRFP